MPGKISQSLGGISETLLMTLYARARETQRQNPMIHDELAVAMVNQIDADFSRLRLQRHDEISIILRMNKFDQHVRAFLARNPDGMVVHIGCGLDTRFERVDNGRVEWFDLDVPEVMALRMQLIHNESSRYHPLISSVFDDGWLDEVSRFKSRPLLFIAEGVLPYFEEAQVKSLFLKFHERFAGCELVCDAHSPFVIWADNVHLALARIKVRMHWSIKQGKDVEGWAEGIRLLDEWHYIEEGETTLEAFPWLRLFPSLVKATGIFHYRL